MVYMRTIRWDDYEWSDNINTWKTLSNNRDSQNFEDLGTLKYIHDCRLLRTFLPPVSHNFLFHLKQNYAGSEMRHFLSVIAIILMIFWAISAGMKSSMTLDFGGNFKNLESSIKSLLETSRAETDYFL